MTSKRSETNLRHFHESQSTVWWIKSETFVEKMFKKNINIVSKREQNFRLLGSFFFQIFLRRVKIAIWLGDLKWLAQI